MYGMDYTGLTIHRTERELRERALQRQASWGLPPRRRQQQAGRERGLGGRRTARPIGLPTGR